ncbi:MAG: hypothetical protein APF78_02210 [Sphingomonadales bacterium BRH_c3]|nr:MAG: hypothetical protein APF78_02210 [Sphingomonadales bacterium BRH_c3]
MQVKAARRKMMPPWCLLPDPALAEIASYMDLEFRLLGTNAKQMMNARSSSSCPKFFAKPEFLMGRVR